MARPAVTFVIPCFNHGRFVREAVESALKQAGADTTVIVVDDGSDDGTSAGACDALAGERVIVFHQPNSGLPAARNHGARQARTEYLVFLDADDYVRPGFVSALHAAIGTDTDPARVSHAYCQEELIELGTGIWKVPEWDPLLLMITNLHPVTALLKRSCFEEVGGFDETMTAGYEDWELWLRLAERGYRGARVREPLFVWRRHSNTTMVMEAVKHHDDLFRQIVGRHGALYDRHARELLVLSNTLLRKFECNWIDETGYPIPLQYLWTIRDRQRYEAERMRAWYEATAAVRLHRSIQNKLAALPGPLSGAARSTLRFLKRLIPRGAPRSS